MHQLDGVDRQHLRITAARPGVPVRIDTGLAQPLQRPGRLAADHQGNVEGSVGDALCGNTQQLLGCAARDGRQHAAGAKCTNGLGHQLPRVAVVEPSTGDSDPLHLFQQARRAGIGCRSARCLGHQLDVAKGLGEITIPWSLHELRGTDDHWCRHCPLTAFRAHR